MSGPSNGVWRPLRIYFSLLWQMPGNEVGQIQVTDAKVLCTSRAIWRKRVKNEWSHTLQARSVASGAQGRRWHTPPTHNTCHKQGSMLHLKHQIQRALSSSQDVSFVTVLSYTFLTWTLYFAHLLCPPSNDHLSVDDFKLRCLLKFGCLWKKENVALTVLV